MPIEVIGDPIGARVFHFVVIKNTGKDFNLAIAKKLYVELSRSDDIALSVENPSKIGCWHLRDLQQRKWIVDAFFDLTG